MDIKATAYAADGSVLKCSFCDKDAGYFIIGATEQINYCKDHMPIEKGEAKFIYRDPGDPIPGEILNLKLILAEDFWTADLRLPEAPDE